MKYIISNNGSVNAFVGGKPYAFNKSHENYDKLLAYLENGNVEHFEASYDIASTVEHYCDGYVHVDNGELTDFPCGDAIIDNLPLPPTNTTTVGIDVVIRVKNN